MNTLSLRPDSIAFLRTAAINGVTKLYHFTDASNLPSIKRCGSLLSWADCDDRGIRIPMPGGDEFSRNCDSIMGLEHYVRLSFVEEHPMMHVAMTRGRIENPVILEINPCVILDSRVKFSDRNAAAYRQGVKVDGSLEHFRSLRFDLFKQDYFDLDSEERHLYQAEVLVPHSLSLKYVTAICHLGNRYCA